MTPINSAMPPLKRARSAEGPIREKRPASVRHEGPKKKKVKTAAIEPEKLSDREIKNLSPVDVRVILSDVRILDRDKLRVLKHVLIDKGLLSEYLPLCMIHCQTEEPALFCLERRNRFAGSASLESKILTLFKYQLCHNFKKEFDYNALYLELIKVIDTEYFGKGYLLHEACRKGVKDLALSCIVRPKDLFEINEGEESALSLAFVHCAKKDFNALLDKIIELSLCGDSSKSIKLPEGLTDIRAKKIAEIFASDECVRSLSVSNKKKLASILSQEDFEIIYLWLFSHLPKTNRRIASLNLVDRPMPEREKVLKVIGERTKGYKHPNMLALFDNMKVSSISFLFWADYLYKDSFFLKSNKLSSNRDLSGSLLERAIDLNRGGFSPPYFFLLSKETKIEVLGLYLNAKGLHSRSCDVNGTLLNRCYFWVVDTFNECGHCNELWDVLRQADVYAVEDGPGNHHPIPNEAWVNHPNEILLRILMLRLKEATFKEHKEILTSLPSEFFVRMVNFCHSNPSSLPTLISDWCTFSEMELKSGGRCLNNWESLLRILLIKLGSFSSKTKQPEWAALKARLNKQREDKASLGITKSLPGEWLSGLEEQGWKKVRRFGRTELFQKGDDGPFMAIKFLKAKEKPLDLYREYWITKVLYERGEKMGLKSKFPRPLHFVEFYGEMPPEYHAGFDTKLRYDQDPGYKILAYIYEPQEDYLRYLDEADDDSYRKGREAVLHDLFYLMNDNVIMTALAGFFHNSLQNRPYIPFPSLFFAWGENMSAGRVDNWEEGVKWSNERVSGLADTQELDFAEDLIKFRQFPNIFYLGNKKRPEPLNILLATFIAQYFLADELILGKREKEAGRLLWRSKKKNEILAEKLRDGARIAFEAATPFSERICRRITKQSGVRYTLWATQLAFWLRNDEKGYVPHIRKGKIPKGIYQEGEVIVGSTREMNNWKKDFGFSRNGINSDIGSYNGVNPIKEGEISRVVMAVLLLAFRKSGEFEEKSYCAGIKSMLDGEFQKARIHFERAITFHPYRKKNWLMLADVHRRLGNNGHEKVCRQQAAALVIQRGWDRRKR